MTAAEDATALILTPLGALILRDAYLFLLAVRAQMDAVDACQSSPALPGVLKL